MIGLTIHGPNQKEKLAAIKLPCALGRLADDANPELSIADPFVSRSHIELVTTPDGSRVVIRCLGSSPITLESGESIQPDDEATCELPVQLRVGRTDICVETIDLGVNFLKPAATQAIQGRQRAQVGALALSKRGEISPQQLVEWFEGLIAFQESATGAKGFYEQAARAVVEMIGLDRCVVVACEDEWKVEVQYGTSCPDGMLYSHSVIGHVLAYRQTAFADTPQFDTPQFDSATGAIDEAAYVGAPIFDGAGAVVACLFGARHGRGDSIADGIRPLEAQLVQVTAGIVGSRLARLAAEAEQTRTQVQLEQFASPQLVREMQENPQWLEAQERELTLLFGDIRGFSKLGERLDAQEIYAFVREVMDCMTQVIHDHGGFVFNFAGDGIAAMWNAPGRTKSHATEACRAAIDIQQALKAIDERWAPRVGRAVQVGLGINTGDALVGNSGSKARLKYSPLGHPVNLASRIEGATKQMGVPVLITDATRKLLGDEFTTRGLGEIVVVGIDHPTRVFQLASDDSNNATAWWPQYTQSMQNYEDGQHADAKGIADVLLASHPNDRPLQILCDRLHRSTGQAQPWVLSGK